MSRLENKLTLWEQQKLISPTQKQQILAFETQNKRPHLLTALFSLGIFILSLGIISLIAANWDEISGTVKLTIDFILLAALATGTIVADARGKIFWKEAGILALFLMTIASIGLISQVFQTNGTLSGGALLASVFSVPLLAVSKKKLLPLLWVPLFLGSIVSNQNVLDFLEPLIRYLDRCFDRFPAMIPVPFIVFFCFDELRFYHLHLLSGRKYPVFTVLRGYFEVLTYCAALFDSFIGYRYSILNLLIPVAVFAGSAWIYYKHNYPKMQNFNIAMIGVCFFIAYIRLFSDLLTTGIGLIVTGLLLLALVWGIKTVINKTVTKKGVK